MRWSVIAVVAVVLAACDRKPPPPPVVDTVEEVYPRLKCPDGTEKVGAAPPEGFRVWCRARLPSGRYEQQGGEVTFHRETGEVAAEGSYDAGRKSGTWLQFYETGELQWEETFEDGRVQGLSTEYWPDGTKRSEGLKVDGYEDGDWNYWHENGQLFKQGAWEDREPNGTWIEYDETGKPVRERQYMFGRMLSHKELNEE